MKTRLSLRARPVVLVAALMAVAVGALGVPAAARAGDVSFTITGKGYGHGIGLSQWGAQGFALQGRDSAWIMAHYFQGTTLAVRESAPVRVNLDAAAQYSSSSGSYNKGYTRTVWRIRPGYVGGTLSIGATTTQSPDLTYTLRSQGGTVTVTGSDGKDYGHFAGSVTLAPGPGDPPLLQVVDASGPFSYTYVRYRGTLTVSANATDIRNTSGAVTQAKGHLRLVNTLGMEDYLLGVVPRESPSSWQPAALEAQAIAARSYAYGSSSDLYCTTFSQVYGGHSKGATRPRTMSDSDGNMHEKESTDRAVAATAGKVVVSGSTVVRTYFSSSSGGYTASIQDVWLSSTPHSYYTGVADADSLAESGNPNATWSAGTLTGATVAADMRAHFSDYMLSPSKRTHAEPSPATVTDIAVERAASGHVRYATLKWSNGASHRVAGDDLRRALGLKSTKYYLVRTPPVVTVTRFQESDPDIMWMGAWTKVAASGSSGGTMRYAGVGGAACYVAFNGTGITWIGGRGPTYGAADVFLDGAPASTVDLYAASVSRAQRVFSRTGLSSGAHTLRIVVRPGANKASHGHDVPVDAFDVSAGKLTQAVLPTTRFEQDDPRIAYGAGWVPESSAQLSSSTALLTRTAGARTYVSFTGSAVHLIGTTGADCGTATVSLDGSVAVLVSELTATTKFQQDVWSAAALDPGRLHTLVITAGGAPGSTTGRAFTLDAVDVVGGGLATYAPPMVRVQDTDRSFVFAGRWLVRHDPQVSGGTQRWTTASGASATVTFEGSSIAWIGSRGAAFGKAKVYLDGRLVAVVDQYARATARRQTLWHSAALAYGAHTLRIVATHTRNRSATGYATAVDAVDVRGRPLPAR